MPRAWMPGQPEDDELEQLFAADREAWRGDVHLADAWSVNDGARETAGDEAWRGGEHLAEWPEGSAGPEYWMYKRAAEGP
jgi:hypothetical protein